jgi:Flp pilus assembly protein TadD
MEKLRPGRLAGLAACAFIAAALSQGEAEAGLLPGRKPAAPAPEAPKTDAVIAKVRLALSEARYTDAGRMLDEALAAGMTDPQLILLSGEVHLARGRDDAAIRSFGAAEASPSLAAQAAAGRGIALSRLGRSDDAVAALTKAVTSDPTLWRAWNALGVEYDRRKNWAKAEEAYESALKQPQATAQVLNNRGYSRLLQGRSEDAAADFVAALRKDPALAQARTNLRLALAMRGDYDKATSVSASENKAALLNNAGFVAMMQGDLDVAEDLFAKAVAARGEFYARAHENLEVTRSLKQAATRPQATTP